MTCQNCTNRHPGCHDKCEIYDTERKEHWKKKKWLNQMNSNYARRAVHVNIYYGDAEIKNKVKYKY